MTAVIRLGARAVAVAVLAFGAFPLRAQASIELAPSVGYYRPTANFGKTQETATWLPAKPSDLSGIALGVDARLWFHNRVGVQLQLSVAYSTIHFDDSTPAQTGAQGSSSPFHSLGAQVQIVTAQVVSNLASPEQHYRVWVSGGPAVVHHGGDAYSFDPTFTSTADVGAALGFGADIPLGNRLRTTFGVESLLYSLHVDNSDDKHSLERGFQTDLMLHAGVSWSVR